MKNDFLKLTLAESPTNEVIWVNSIRVASIRIHGTGSKLVCTNEVIKVNESPSDIINQLVKYSR